jgi:hypothetical protein
MGYDKFGLDWNVWGAGASSGSGPSNAPLGGIGSGWSSNPNQTAQEDGDDGTSNSTQTTARLSNAKFLPDETTDFNQPCKVQVEVESSQPVTSQVVIALWGKYKDEEHNLQHEIKAAPENGIASGELKLYHVDAYFDDVASGVTGESVYYIAKCSLKGASPVDSEPLQMPLVEGITLLFEDDDSKPIANVKVTIASGEEFLSDEEGKVVIPAPSDGSEVEVVKIELGAEEPEAASESGSSEAAQETASETDTPDSGATEPAAPVDSVVSDQGEETEAKKNTVIYFKDSTGKLLANAKVVLSDGRSFTSDDKGEVSIPESEDQNGELSITQIELAEV